MTISVESPGPDSRTSESALTNLGDALVTNRGWTVKKVSTALNAKDGFPQRIYSKGNKLLFVEYLSSNGRPTRSQQEWKSHLESVEGVSQGAVDVLFVKPENWSELRQATL